MRRNKQANTITLTNTGIFPRVTYGSLETLDLPRQAERELNQHLWLVAGAASIVLETFGCCDKKLVLALRTADRSALGPAADAAHRAVRLPDADDSRLADPGPKDAPGNLAMLEDAKWLLAAVADLLRRTDDPKATPHDSALLGFWIGQRFIMFWTRASEGERMARRGRPMQEGPRRPRRDLLARELETMLEEDPNLTAEGVLAAWQDEFAPPDFIQDVTEDERILWRVGPDDERETSRKALGERLRGLRKPSRHT